jgi:hypothetical protein
MIMTELLLGCGHSRKKQACIPGDTLEWKDLVTLDSNPLCDPDIVCDLNEEYWLPNGSYPRLRTEFIGDHYKVEPDDTGYWTVAFKENIFTEIHAYEVLEHLGRQGDVQSFFSTFRNIYDILVPDGVLFATCPSRHSAWAWGDPGHTRLIQPEHLIFLDQGQYKFQLGKTAMSDYRSIWKGDFQCLSSTDDKTFHRFVLQAKKPARI